MINNLGAYIGLGIVSVGIAILWLLAEKPAKHKKHKSHSKSKIKHSHNAHA